MSTKEELQEELKRFKSYFNKSYGTIFCFDIKEPYSIDLPEDTQLKLLVENAYFSQVNNGLLKAYGYDSPDAFLGKGVYTVFPKDDPNTEETFRNIVLAKYDYHNLLSKEIDSSGNLIYFLNELVPEIENGKLIRVWGTSFNVTNRVLSEEFERLINNLITSFVDCPFEEVDSKMRAGIQEILGFLNFDWGIIFERNSENEFLPVIETAIKPVELKKKTFSLVPISESAFPYLFDVIANQRKVFDFSSIEELPEKAKPLKQFCKEEGLLSQVYIPLITSGQCNAILVFSGMQHELSLPDAFKNRLKLLGEVFARLIHRRNTEIKLQEAYAQLEEKVKIRTQKLTDALTTLKDTQEELIRSEKLVVLGQLVSGVAHEINNPLGAIKASNENISHSYESIKINYPNICHQLNKEFHQLFVEALNSISSINLSKSSNERRELKKQVFDKLEEDAIPSAEWIADSLIELGLTNGFEKYYGLLKHDKQELIVNTLYDFGQIQHSSQNIKKAIDQTSKIVFALNSYNYNSRANKKIKSYIPDTIENALVIFQSKLKQDIEVIKKYNQVSHILCNPTEINQVWINIIQNALQAMDYKGTLEIGVKEATTQNLNGHKFDHPTKFIVSSFTNDGPVISKDVIDQIFDPFFTTKPSGQGTGLGLDLSMKIIKNHHGTILVDSKPGKTTFEVWLQVDDMFLDS